MMMLTFGIVLSIGMVASYPIHRQGIRPSPNQVFASKAFPKPGKRRSTSVFYRDEGESLDSIGVQRSPIKNDERVSEFQNRMKRTLVKQKKSNNSMYRPENVQMATSLEEFANVIEEGRREEKLVVAQFYANWCKKCHTLRPSFARAANSHPQVIFVDVPVLNANSNLHQGLGVESVPFGHIYHPQKGLVEETKLSRKTFSEFEGLMKMHCKLDLNTICTNHE